MLDPCRIGGGLFLALGALNTWLDVSTYGAEQGFYVWVCNGGLFFIAVGLLAKDQNCLIAFLAYCLTQLFWIADNLWRLATGEALFGLTEYMYQPGASMAQFVVGHYHYFMIPAALAGLFFVKTDRRYAKTLVLLWGVAFFGSAYFIFPAGQNINCVHSSCFAFAPASGGLYSLAWSGGITALALAVAAAAEKWHARLRPSATQKKGVLALLVGSIVVAVSLTWADVSYKRSLPSFRCEGPFAGPGLRMSCRYTRDYDPGRMELTYLLENKSAERLRCVTKISIDGDESVMDAALELPAGLRYGGSFVLPYPSRDAVGRLSADCRRL